MKKDMVRLAAAVGFGVIAAANAAQAEDSKVLFSHKSWQVEVVKFDDGSLACVAQVSEPGESFSIWALNDQTVRLQFYSDQWSFNNETADLELKIDRRTPWTLTNAELNENSVLFNLPSGDPAVRFVTEVAQGNTLILRTDSGDQVQTYSLAGSRASIDALIQCGDVLVKDGTPENPFN